MKKFIILFGAFCGALCLLASLARGADDGNAFGRAALNGARSQTEAKVSTSPLTVHVEYDWQRMVDSRTGIVCYWKYGTQRIQCFKPNDLGGAP